MQRKFCLVKLFCWLGNLMPSEAGSLTQTTQPAKVSESASLVLCCC